MGALEIILLVLVVLMLCGSAYGRYGGPAPAPYSGPVGIVGLLLLVILIVVLFRGFP